MGAFLNFISNNAIASTLVGAAILGGVAWATKSYKDRSDGTAIHEFLVKSKAESGYDFRSTEAIASNTKLSEDRVAQLCASHPKIRRNEKQLQSWTLVE